jgi:hypothetical protein
MAEFLINDVSLFVSKDLEASYNQDVIAGNKYAKIRTLQAAYVLPQVEFINDAGVPGNGHEFATTWCPSYISHPAFTITDDVNFGIAGRLALRALGGTVSVLPIVGLAHEHSCDMLPISSGRQLPSFTMISELGGASFRCAGMVVDRFRLSQNRADRPQYTVDMIGSGDFTTPFQRIRTVTISNAAPAVVTGTAHGLVADDRVKFSTTGTLPTGLVPGIEYFVLSSGLTANAFEVSATSGGTAIDTTTAGSGTHTIEIAGLPTQMDIADCLNGADAQVEWTDASGTVNFSGTTCSLRSWFVEIANNSRLNDRCPGDPTKTLTYNTLTTTPAHVNRLRRGNRVVTAQLVILLDQTIGTWERYVTGEQITNVVFRARGSTLAGPGARFALQVVVRKARIQSIEPGEVDGEATMTINLLGMYDSIAGGPVQVFVTNQESSDYA